MTNLPSEIFRKWGHSGEEDNNDIRVYRPEGFNFPRARGRAGLEIRGDGTFVDWIIGPTDAQQPLSGHWKIESLDMERSTAAGLRLRLLYEGNLRPSRLIEIKYLDSNVLKLTEVSETS
jgi:hypothetical protein